MTHATKDSVLPAEAAALVTKAVVAACGKQSGSLATDAFLTDPRSCHWNPGTLECEAGQSNNWLTAPQVQALRLIYDGPRDPQTRALISPGMNRRVKLQAQKILCLIFSGRSAWPPLAGQEARSSKRRLIKL